MKKIKLNTLNLIKKISLIGFSIILIYSVILFALYPINQILNEYPYRKNNWQVHYSKYKLKNYIEFEKMNPFLIDAITASEDWSFFEHIGIDLRQIFYAIKESLLEGKKLRGASTITQQLVKNAFFTNEKNFIRKFSEIFLSLKLDFYLPKNKILEKYLNIIEFGPNIYGIHKASYYYFDQSIFALNEKQILYLVSIIPNPKKYGTNFKNKKQLSLKDNERILRIINNLVISKKYSKHRLNEILQLKIILQNLTDEDIQK